MPVDYHAWTHRPKELGGTDPLDVNTLPYCYMRWIGSEAVTANTMTNPATVGTPDVPYEEGFIYDPKGLASFELDLDLGIIQWNEPGEYYVNATVEFNGTGSGGETLGAIIRQGTAGSFAASKVINSVTADIVNENAQIPVSVIMFSHADALGQQSIRIDCYHTDAGGNNVGAVKVHVVQLNSNTRGEFVTP